MSTSVKELILSMAALCLAIGSHAQPSTATTATKPEAAPSGSEAEPDRPPVSTPATTSPNEESLRQAALAGSVKQVDALLKGGTAANATGPDQRTALMLAAFNGHTEVLRHLLEAGATVTLADAFGRTALHYASTGTSEESVRLLVDQGADVNRRDGGEQWTPLMYAAAEGNLGVVTLLLKAGADLSAEDTDGESALDFAANNGHTAVADQLREPPR